jgi:hypothetical protein
LIWAFLFLVWRVIFGSNPMNEYVRAFLVLQWTREGRLFCVVLEF